MSCLKLFAPVELTVYCPDDTPLLRVFRGDDDGDDVLDDEPVLLQLPSTVRWPEPRTERNGSPTTGRTSGNVVYVPVVGSIRPASAPAPVTSQSAPRLRLFVSDN